MKKIYVGLICFGVLILIIGLCLLLSDNKLGDFYIESFDQDITSEQLNVLKWSKSKNASEYKVIITDKNNNILKEEVTINSGIIINDLNIIDGNTFNVDIIAYNKKKESKKVKEVKTFSWNLPMIKVNYNEMIVSDKSDIKDIMIDVLNGDNQKYYIVILKNQREIQRFDIEKQITIDASIFKKLDNFLGKYEILLCQQYDDRGIILNKKYINIVPIPITDIIINKPVDNSEVPYEDLLINFSGGKHVNKFYYTLKDEMGKTIISNAVIYPYEFTINKDKLKPNTSYNLTIMGQHFLDDSVTKTVSTTFKVAPANKVSKIMSTKPSGEVGFNRAIRLFTYTDATIYYTLDGSTPTKDSIEYTGSIYINRDLTIKAIAIKDGMINSDILELNYKPVEREPAIYLSPSTQENNLGVSSVGYTTEKEMMNRISDYIEERLKEKNIIVYRNRPDMTLSEIVNESSKYDVDLHLAIHSNDYNGKMYGVETWIHNDRSSEAIKIANLIQDALMRIYYNPKGNRGIKYSEPLGGLRETSPKNVTNGVLVEIAFHDHYNDAKWMVDNQKKIGYAIADAVIAYFSNKN